MRPAVFDRAGFPPQIGWGAENAAHRIAVKWDDAHRTHQGVYVRQRHGASWLAIAAGGRIFPGVHEYARFEGSESKSRIRIAVTLRNTTVIADVAVTGTFASDLFSTVADAGEVLKVRSSLSDALRPGSAPPDSVLVMRDVPITRSLPKETISQSTGL